MPSGSLQENTPSEPVYGSVNVDAGVATGEPQPLRHFADILEQILSTSENSDATADPCQSALLAIAARHSSLDFCADPVLIDLIHVITQQIKGLSDRRRMAMERAVATSLVDDQVSHGRLQNFWEQLKRSASDGQ